ncbi:unnamed protein product [Closterium sp. NIES-64]|nr:unnamed protein product [Closterium sp. NIES-64]
MLRAQPFTVASESTQKLLSAGSTLHSALPRHDHLWSHLLLPNPSLLSPHSQPHYLQADPFTAHYLQADPFTVHRLDMFTSRAICFAAPFPLDARPFPLLPATPPNQAHYLQADLFTAHRLDMYTSGVIRFATLCIYPFPLHSCSHHIHSQAHYLQADPFTVHRLDMYTSGVICFAKSRPISQALHQAFRTKDQVRWREVWGGVGRCGPKVGQSRSGSGVICFAKSRPISQALHQAFRTKDQAFRSQDQVRREGRWEGPGEKGGEVGGTSGVMCFAKARLVSQALYQAFRSQDQMRHGWVGEVVVWLGQSRWGRAGGAEQVGQSRSGRAGRAEQVGQSRSGSAGGAEQVGQRKWGSGVICFAKTRLVSLDLQQALSPKDQVAKQYLVLVLGLPPSDPFVVDAPLARDPDHEFDFLCVFDSPCPSQVAKQYLVLVVGLPRLESFTVDAPIARDPDHEFARMVVGEDIVEMRGDGVADKHMERKGEETGKEGTEGGKEGVGESVEESGAQKKEECGSGTQKKESKIQEARTEFSVLARSEASGYDACALRPFAFPCTPLHSLALLCIALHPLHCFAPLHCIAPPSPCTCVQAHKANPSSCLSPPRLASLPSPLPPCRLFIYPSGYPFYKPSQ